jgi:hypothetical protein
VTFDPRPYLDAIAEEVDCGAEIDCPATTAQRIRLAGTEIDRLRADLAQRTAERDEARRDWCYAMEFGHDERAEERARLLGWDCFKEEGHP